MVISNMKYFCTEMLAPCEHTFTSESGTLNSPGYPYYYANDLRCQWTITVQPGKTITLDFISFEVEYSDTCGHDALEIM